MKRRHFFRRLLIGILLFLLVIFIVCAVYLFQWEQTKKENLVVDQDLGNTLRDPKGDLLFLLVGIDTTKDPKEPTRTDTIMLVRIDARDHMTYVLSIPRDTRCSVEGSLDKINHAHAYGGMEETLQTVRLFLGVDVDYYIEATYDLVAAVIDAAGGVEYEVPEGVAFDWSEEPITAGRRHFNGNEAIGYLRHRDSYPEGDLGRVAAQQAFLKTALSQVLAPGNVLRYPLILKAGLDNVHTNLSALENLGNVWALSQMKAEDISFATLPGTPEYIDGVSYYLPDSEGTLSLVNDWFAPFVME